MNTNTSIRYLDLAIDKNSQPLHPNFKKNLKQKQLAVHMRIREVAAKAYDANPGNPRAAIVASINELKGDAQTLVTFVKALCRDAAFAAHMDCLAFERREFDISAEMIDNGIGAMIAVGADETDTGFVHPVTLGDVGLADVSASLRNAQREQYAGEQPEPVATSIEDAYEAIDAVQGWLSLPFAKMPDDQQEYWGIPGLVPFTQRVDETPAGKEYTPIVDFDEYREVTSEEWKKRSRRVDVPVDITEAMLES